MVAVSRHWAASHLKSACFATCVVGLVIGVLPAAGHASAQLNWMGHDWTITNGRMAGVARGRPSNVQVDSNGYLHLMITKKRRSVTAGELFSNDSMGFGTYQWEIQGPVD